MKKKVRLLIVLILLLPSIQCFSQSKIDRSKRDLTSTRSSNSSNNQNNRDSNSSSDLSFDNEFTYLIYKSFLYLTYYSIIGNYEFENHLHSNLTDYPYQNNVSGNFENSDVISPTTKYLRVDIEDQILLGHNEIYGNHLKAKIRPSHHFYIQTDLFTLLEYNKIEKNYSNLSLMNFNLCYDRMRFEKFNLGWSIGLNYIGNEVQKAGFSYGLNTDIFIAAPYSIYSSIKWSTINTVPVNEFELKGRYHKNNYFLTAGYEHLKIGSPTYDFLAIGGGLFLF